MSILRRDTIWEPIGAAVVGCCVMAAATLAGEPAPGKYPWTAETAAAVGRVLALQKDIHPENTQGAVFVAGVHVPEVAMSWQGGVQEIRIRPKDASVARGEWLSSAWGNEIGRMNDSWQRLQDLPRIQDNSRWQQDLHRMQDDFRQWGQNLPQIQDTLRWQQDLHRMQDNFPQWEQNRMTNRWTDQISGQLLDTKMREYRAATPNAADIWVRRKLVSDVADYAKIAVAGAGVVAGTTPLWSGIGAGSSIAETLSGNPLARAGSNLHTAISFPLNPVSTAIQSGAQNVLGWGSAMRPSGTLVISRSYEEPIRYDDGHLRINGWIQANITSKYSEQSPRFGVRDLMEGQWSTITKSSSYMRVTKGLTPLKHDYWTHQPLKAPDIYRPSTIDWNRFNSGWNGVNNLNSLRYNNMNNFRYQNPDIYRPTYTPPPRIEIPRTPSFGQGYRR